MPDQWWYWVVLIGANTPLFWLFGWAVFGQGGSLLESIGYMLRPNYWWSQLRDDWADEVMAEGRLWMFGLACAAPVVIEHLLIQHYFFR